MCANHKPIMKMPKLSWMSKLITTGEQWFFAKTMCLWGWNARENGHILCIYVRISIIIYIYMSDKMSECPNMCQNVRIVVMFWWLNLHSLVTMGNCFLQIKLPKGKSIVLGLDPHCVMVKAKQWRLISCPNKIRGSYWWQVFWSELIP